ncbi:glycosyltransferase family 2 protein [Candidatus Dependentiae bacterium]
MTRNTFTKSIILFFLSFSFLHAHTEEKSHIKYNYPEKPMVIEIPSYNNKDWYKRNLDSVFNQNYTNYRIIYTNDASTDGTGDLVEQYIKERGQEHRVTIIHNKENRGAMANHYTAAHMCKDYEIILHLDGDDWFKHENVLQIVNKAYNEKNIWLTYGQFERLYYKRAEKTTNTKLGTCDTVSKKVILHNAYRQIQWITSSLRTFYAGLFKHIKLKDLLCDGTFYNATCDLGLMYPMVEMTGGKFSFIEEVLYVYNKLTNLSDNKLRVLRQVYLKHFIRSQKSYEPLQIDKPIPSRNIPQHAHTDLIIISEGNPAYLYAMIESVRCYTNAIDKIYVLKDPCHGTYRDLYEQVKKDYPKVELIKVNPTNFKSMLESILELTHNKHILLAQGNCILKDFVDISMCIELLESTYAHGFYLSLGENIQENTKLVKTQNIPVHTELQDGIFFWQFAYGQQEWKKPFALSMALYRKKDILSLITPIHYTCSQDLCNAWHYQGFDLRNIGLFFKESKALALEAKKETILEKLRAHMKINIAPLFLLQNKSSTEHINLEFQSHNLGNISF